MKRTSQDFDYVILERTPCFGCCPVYKVKVYSSGLVEWEGIEFVAKKGKAKWYISTEKAKGVAEKAEKFISIFREFERAIEKGQKVSYATDHPSCTITIKYQNGDFKSADHYHGIFPAPKQLKKLEKEIGKITGIEKLVGKQQ